MIKGKCLIIVAFCTQLPLAAMAADFEGLKAETPATDSAQHRQLTSTSSTTPSVQSTDTEISTATSSEHMLYGSARKHDTLPTTGAASAQQSSPQDLNTAADDAAHLQSEKAAADAYALALQKLSQRQELTAEDFRSLGIGILGYESLQPFFEKVGQVTKLYADFPAAQAGIRVGDEEVSEPPDPNEEREKADPGQPLWTVNFHKVGVPVDITILRNKQPVKYTLITRNMEDIKEPKIRRMFEKMVLDLGYPQEGSFTGTSMHNLARDN